MSDYAKRQLERVRDDGPAGGEDWFRLRVTGEIASHHLNISPAQLDAVIVALGDDQTPELRFHVGVTETCTRIARFDTAEHASAFIGLLPDHEDGRYYIDGPEAS